MHFNPLTPTVAIWEQVSKVSSPFPSLKGPWAALIFVSCSPQPDTSRSCKTTDTGLVHRVVWPFTPLLSLILINRPRRDGTLSWRWYTAATGRSQTRDLAIANSGTVPLGHRALGTAIKHPVPDWVKPSFVIFECPDVKNYKWRLNPVWPRFLYSCTQCLHGNNGRQRVQTLSFALLSMG